MFERKEHKEEAVVGYGEVKEYEKRHERRAGSMYGPLLKEMRSTKPRGRCLEVGAGSGILACLLAQEHPEITITASDFSPHMVDLARSNARKKGLGERISCVCADVNDAQQVGRLGTFDLIYSAYSLHHWRDPARALANLWGALEKGGTLYILDLRRVWWLYVVPSNDGFIASVRASYRPREIDEIFSGVGITRYRVETSFPYFIHSIVASK